MLRKWFAMVAAVAGLLSMATAAGAATGLPAVGSADPAWVVAAGGPAAEAPGGVATDADGNSYVVSNVGDSASFGTGQNVTPVPAGTYLAKYNRGGRLVWVKSLVDAPDGAGVSSIATDGHGGVIVAGFFFGIAHLGDKHPTVLSSSPGNPDPFVARYTTSGRLDWAEQGFTSSGGTAASVAITARGDILVLGSYQDQMVLDTGRGRHRVTLSGGPGTYLARYSRNGRLEAARTVATGSVGVNAMALDGQGGLYVTGVITRSGSSSPIATFGQGAQAVSFAPDQLLSAVDLFVSRFSEAGDVAWAQLGGGDRVDVGLAVAADASGVLVAGISSPTASYGPPGRSQTVQGAAGFESLVAKFDRNGEVLWVRLAGGGQDDYAYGVAMDGHGNSFVTGGFTGTADFSGQTLTAAGVADAFIAEYDASGALVWIEQMGGPDLPPDADYYALDLGRSVAVDGARGVVVAGQFMQTAHFGPNDGGVTLTSAGRTDIFVARYQRWR